MAAKSGIFDFILKGASKNMGKAAPKAVNNMPKNVGRSAAKPASGRVGPNLNVLPSSPGAATSAGRTRNYIAETGRPMVVNGRPIPNSLMRPAPAKKAAHAKKMAPAKKIREQLARMGRAEAIAKAARTQMTKETKMAQAKERTAARYAAKKAERMQKLKAEKAPVPPKGAIPVKKAQPGRVSPETARKLAVMNKNKTYTQRRDAVRMLPAKPPVKKFR